MPKEMNSTPDVNPELVERLSALPDPGADKKLIVFVRGSTVRLRVTEIASTIEEQETGSGGGRGLPPR